MVAFAKKSQKTTHTSKASIIFAFLFSIFSTNLFATDPNIPAGATSASCDNSTLNTYSGTSNLQANWEANKIDLYWYSDDEQITTVQDAATSCNYDSGLSVPSTSPTKTGYTFNGWKVRGLPDGYTRVNGITNSGNVRIDTNITDDVDDMEYELRVKPSLGSWYIFQSRQVAGGALYGFAGNNSGSTINANNGGSSFVSVMTRNTEHVYYLKFIHKNGARTLYVKDETTGAEDTQAGTYTGYTPATAQIRLFCNGASQCVSGANTVYMARLKKNGVLVRNFIPAKNSSNVVGMYDTVSKTFFTNAGSGSFTAGPVVQ